MSVRDGVATPRMRRQLRVLAALAGFAAVVIFFGFVAAFRNNATSEDVPGTLVRLDVAGLSGGDFTMQRVPADVVIEGERQREVELLVVQTGATTRAFWSRSTHLGCGVRPIETTNISHRRGTAFGDPCGGAQFALDGRCIGGPCPRGLDEFVIVERDGVAYADLDQMQRGAPRTR